MTHLKDRPEEVLGRDLPGSVRGASEHRSILEDGAGFRPKRQRDANDSKSQCLVYQLTDDGKRAIEPFPYPPTVSNGFVHDLMAACFVSSVELATRNDDNTFRPRPGKLTSEKFDLTPDDLFGLKYADGRTRWFAVEVDRNTESLDRLAKKLSDYNQMLRDKAFHTRWGIKNLNVLILTTNKRHMQNIMALVPANVDKQYHNRFKFAYEPIFGTRGDAEEESYWRVPKYLLTWLYETEWLTTEGEVYINRA